jgi:hypothetical protein
MFLKDRTRAGRGRGRPGRPDTRTDEECLTLTGVVWQGRQWVAFFEDARDGHVQRAATGDAVCHGTVAGMTLDSVQYSTDQTTTAVPVGNTLAGTAAASSPAATASGPAEAAASQPASGEAVSSPAANDVLERMRQRRAQEESQ